MDGLDLVQQNNPSCISRFIDRGRDEDTIKKKRVLSSRFSLNKGRKQKLKPLVLLQRKRLLKLSVDKNRQTPCGSTLVIKKRSGKKIK